MENASKALMIAGGVLITIIIVSVLVFAFDQFKSLPKTQEEIKQAEQLEQFNKKYESYNKKNMYGADVVSVINMANNNNESTNANDEKYWITVTVKLKNKIERKLRMFYYDSEKNKNFEAYNVDGTTYPKTLDERLNNIEGDKEYIVAGQGSVATKKSVWRKEVLASAIGDSDSEFVYVESDSDTSKRESPNKIRKTNIKIDGKKYTEVDVYYMKTNLEYEFKSRKFDCTGIEYAENGRVNKIQFVEK